MNQVSPRYTYETYYRKFALAGLTRPTPWLAVVSGTMFFGALLAWPAVHHRSASIHWPSIRSFHKDAGIVWLNRNYPIGKTVIVYYDPADPDFSVLEPGAKDLIFIWRWSAGSLAFCFFLALAMRFRALRRRGSNTPLDRQVL